MSNYSPACLVLILAQIQMVAMRQELATVRSDLKLLVGTERDVASTNGLLAELRQQHRQTANAQESLDAVKRVNRSLIDQHSDAVAAAASLEQMITLQDGVMA